MIEYLESIDRAIVLAVNSWNASWMDEIMWWVSARITWIPYYLVLIYFIYRKIGLKFAVLYVSTVVLTIVIADLISVYALKEVFHRYRPSHNSLLSDQLHFYQLSPSESYRGGQYGFVSSHATNFFVLASSFCLVFYRTYPKLTYFTFGIALLICYSRIYLGVHYLSDIIGGAILGSFLSFLVYHFVWKKVIKR